MVLERNNTFFLCGPKDGSASEPVISPELREIHLGRVKTVDPDETRGVDIGPIPKVKANVSRLGREISLGFLAKEDQVARF